MAETRTPTREAEVISAAARNPGEHVTSAVIAPIEDHDSLIIEATLAPVRVVTEIEERPGQWREYAAFTANGLPGDDLLATTCWQRVTLPPVWRRNIRVRLEPLARRAMSVRVRTSFDGERFIAGTGPRSVAYDAVSSSSGGAVTSLSWTHTPSGTPEGIVLCAGSGALTNYATISSPTYGGAAFGDEHTEQATGNGVFYLASIKSKLSPAAGAQTVALTYSRSTSAGAGAISVVGNDLSDLMGATFSATADMSAGTNADTRAIDIDDGDLAVDIIVGNNAGGPNWAVTTSNTERFDVQPSNTAYAASTQGGSGTVSLGWQADANARFIHIAGKINQAAAAGIGIPIAAYHYNHHLGSMA